MTSDEQEAESLKYSNKVGIILKLESGAWALFNNQRRLLAISFSIETISLHLAGIESTVEKAPKAHSSQSNLLTEIDLDSLLDGMDGLGMEI